MCFFATYLSCPKSNPHTKSTPSTFTLTMAETEKKDSVLQSIEDTKATYKRLGKTGLRVSVPILGAMSFGDEAWQPWVLDEEKVQLTRWQFMINQC
jgi:hypothetical protein